jgi:hypothetical protein
VHEAVSEGGILEYLCGFGEHAFLLLQPLL